MNEFLDVVSRVTEAISALTNATDGLRTLTLLIAAALARQKNIDTKQFIQDVSDLADEELGHDVPVPFPVADFLAVLKRQLQTGK